VLDWARISVNGLDEIRRREKGRDRLAPWAGPAPARPGRLSREEAEALGRLLERYGRKLAESLEKLCRSRIEVEAGTWSEMGARELKRHLGEGGVQIVFSAPGESGGALLVLERELAGFLVDCLLGGPGEAGGTDVLVTEVERELVAEAAAPLLTAFGEAWEGGVPFSGEVEEVVTEGPPERLLEKATSAAVGELRVRGERVESRLSLCLLLAGGEGVLGALGRTRWAEERRRSRAQERARVKAVIEEVEVPVRAVVGRARLPLAALAELSVGDIICLDSKCSEELEVEVGGREPLGARAIEIEGRLGMQVSGEPKRGGG
jgi:flagellar motor switch protein FliM